MKINYKNILDFLKLNKIKAYLFFIILINSFFIFSGGIYISESISISNLLNIYYDILFILFLFIDNIVSNLFLFIILELFYIYLLSCILFFLINKIKKEIQIYFYIGLTLFFCFISIIIPKILGVILL